MLLVLTVGGLTGWMAYVIRTQREAIAAVHAGGGNMVYDWEIRSAATPSKPHAYVRTDSSGPTAPAWLRRFMGDELFQQVVLVQFPTSVTPEAVAALRYFDQLVGLQLGNSEPVAFDLSVLGGHRRLRTLTLWASATGDARIAEIARIDSLEVLVLHWSQEQTPSLATDAGFGQLARLASLRELMIGDSPGLTDSGVLALARLPQLRALDLIGTKVTPEGVAALQQAAPQITKITIRPAITPATPAAPPPISASKGK